MILDRRCTSDTPYLIRPRLPVGPWSSFRFTLITESITLPHSKHCQPGKQSDELPASSNRMVTIKPWQRRQFMSWLLGSTQLTVSGPLPAPIPSTMQGQTARNEEGPGNARDGTASGAEHARETCWLPPAFRSESPRYSTSKFSRLVWCFETSHFAQLEPYGFFGPSPYGMPLPNGLLRAFPYWLP